MNTLNPFHSLQASLKTTFAHVVAATKRSARSGKSRAARNVGKVGIASLFACGALLLSSPQAHAYDDDTHYYFTFYLANRAGYTPNQAFKIASANVDVDYDADTEPVQWKAALNPFGDAQTPRIRFHAFLDSRLYDDVYEDTFWSWKHLWNSGAANDAAVEAVEEDQQQKWQAQWDRALQTGNPGEFLHYEMDTFAHQGYYSLLGHSLDGHRPDYLSNDLFKADAMSRDVLWYLYKFRLRGSLADSDYSAYALYCNYKAILHWINFAPFRAAADNLYNAMSPQLRQISDTFTASMPVVLALANANPSPSFFSSPDSSKAKPVIANALPGIPVPDLGQRIQYDLNAQGYCSSADWPLWPLTATVGQPR